MAEATRPHGDAVGEFAARVERADVEAVERLLRFGSVANGTHRPDSDVDVLAIVDDDADATAVEERLRDVAYDGTLERGPAFSIHAVGESTVAERADHPFFRSVFGEGQPIDC